MAVKKQPKDLSKMSKRLQNKVIRNAILFVLFLIMFIFSVVNLIRWAEVGELRNQNDLEKLIKISTIIGETTGIKSYIYTHNKSLNFTSSERPYLTINGSGFMVDNEYRVIEKELIENEFKNLNDLSNKRECICDCTKCSYCSTKQNYILIEEVR